MFEKNTLNVHYPFTSRSFQAGFEPGTYLKQIVKHTMKPDLNAVLDENY